MGKRFENFANQTAERGLIRAGVNTGETDFFKPLFKQFPNLPEDFVFRYRAVVAAGIGDDTIGAAMVAALLNLYESPLPSLQRH